MSSDSTLVRNDAEAGVSRQLAASVAALVDRSSGGPDAGLPALIHSLAQTLNEAVSSAFTVGNEENFAVGSVFSGVQQLCRAAEYDHEKAQILASRLHKLSTKEGQRELFGCYKWQQDLKIKFHSPYGTTQRWVVTMFYHNIFTLILYLGQLAAANGRSLDEINVAFNRELTPGEFDGQQLNMGSRETR